ncbi:MAG: Uma2 family endonuclease [Pyrinomonadaceae bacterium]
MSTQPTYYLSPEEYLAIERQAEYRSEYVDGIMYQMAGGSEAHNLLTGNIVTELNIHSGALLAESIRVI